MKKTVFCFFIEEWNVGNTTIFSNMATIFDDFFSPVLANGVRMDLIYTIIPPLIIQVYRCIFKLC